MNVVQNKVQIKGIAYAILMTGMVWLNAPLAFAQNAPADPPTVTAAAPEALPAPAPPPPPYSLPWQLRPLVIGNVVRSDTSVAIYKNPTTGDSGSSVATFLLGAYKLTPNLAPVIRLGVVQNQEPGPAVGGGAAFVNPVVGLTYGRKFGGDFRYAFFGGVTVPVGTGGDKAAKTDEGAAAISRGPLARSAMDNAMFAVNYFSFIGGADVGYVAHKVTIQAEATIFELLRVRNEMFAPDKNRTNLTTGVHAGYSIISLLSIGAEIRYQRWLSTPLAVTKDSTARDTVSFAVGPRFHIKTGRDTWLRPGISYARGLDAPMTKAKYNLVQIDIPFAF